MKTYKKINTAAICLFLSLTSGWSYAGWGIGDLDVFNKNSGIRKSGRELDQRRIEAAAYKLSLHNKCAERLSVTLEYIPIGSSNWKTGNYMFSPGEHAFLVSTRNQYAYISAQSISSYSDKKWRRSGINMAGVYNYTHSLTCN